MLTGKVNGRYLPRHRHEEFLTFLKTIDAEVPRGLQVHLILDNYSTHKHANVAQWLKRHRRFHLHFTPTSSSWLNQVERWFRDLTDKDPRRGIFRAGRTCYRHLAGKLAVDLLDGLVGIGVVTRDWQFGQHGREWFARLGIAPASSRRLPLRPCLDWTERREHLAGSYGDALCDHLLRESWAERHGSTRAVRFTDLGRTELARLGVDLPTSDGSLTGQ